MIIIINNDNKEVIIMNTDITVLKEMDWGAVLPLLLPVIILHLLLLVIALIDLYRRRTIVQRPFVWLAIILLFNTIGPILYLIVGRRLLKSD
jgi:hypothetical protein